MTCETVLLTVFVFIQACIVRSRKLNEFLSPSVLLVVPTDIKLFVPKVATFALGATLEPVGAVLSTVTVVLAAELRLPAASTTYRL